MVKLIIGIFVLFVIAFFFPEIKALVTRSKRRQEIDSAVDELDGAEVSAQAEEVRKRAADLRQKMKAKKGESE